MYFIGFLKANTQNFHCGKFFDNILRSKAAPTRIDMTKILHNSLASIIESRFILNLRSADSQSLSLPTTSGTSSIGSLRFAPSWGNIGAPLDVEDENTEEFERELYRIDEVNEQDVVSGTSVGTTYGPGVVGDYRAVAKRNIDEEEEEEEEEEEKEERESLLFV
ncbi:hypothetical protein C8Q74DRAFT_1222427 [Fomes fomentarius]|nr:hypothetical protein C8Q74DRAFT_1222427 [Fomes fomentarius]